MTWPGQENQGTLLSAGPSGESRYIAFCRTVTIRCGRLGAGGLCAADYAQRLLGARGHLKKIFFQKFFFSKQSFFSKIFFSQKQIFFQKKVFFFHNKTFFFPK